jgi:hypothetical protein
LRPDGSSSMSRGGLLVGNGQVATLTRQEFTLFEALWSARPRTLSKEKLLDAIYGLLPPGDEPEIKIIDVFVCKIRKKVAPLGFAIETVWASFGFANLLPFISISSSSSSPPIDLLRVLQPVIALTQLLHI